MSNPIKNQKVFFAEENMSYREEYKIRSSEPSILLEGSFVKKDSIFLFLLIYEKKSLSVLIFRGVIVDWHMDICHDIAFPFHEKFKCFSTIGESHFAESVKSDMDLMNM